MYLGITFVPNVPADGPYELSSNIMACNANILVYGLNKNKVLEQIITNQKYSKINEQLKMIVQLDTIEPQPLLHNGKPISINVYSSKQLFNIGNGLCLSQIPYFPIEDLSNSKLFICFTSGTTGHSKGVIHSHRSFMATIQNFILHEKHFGLTIGSPMPLGHISGTLCISKAISNAMTLVLFNNHNTEHIVKSIEKYRIAHLMVTSACLSDMAKENYPKLYDLSCLTQFQFIGSKPPSKLLKIVKEKYHVELLELYGSSEFLGIVNNSITCPQLLFQEWESGNLGPLIANVEMKVIDLNTSVALPANQQGELCFRGKPCFVGYLNNLEATKTAIDSNGWYHTGDIGYYDQRGFLFMTDRIKEIVKFRIWSVFPAEIENFIQTVPSVKGVCVVGVPHVTDGYWLRAYVELADEEQNITEQWLTNFVAGKYCFYNLYKN
ncbi:hypothetical protein RDWZM_009051 [Blomia tropicalis]|uniref:Uncharacterized protein n=1 Tax=Blomia tropicalis TaxID=40697 RepID=A0A9Q0M2Z2_BLOTA|nr:hypothetical protein RDWZM_009051 [Blomia tropicalis]